MRSILRRIIPALAASFLISQPVMAELEIPTKTDSNIEGTLPSAFPEPLIKTTIEPAEIPDDMSATFSPNRNEASCVALAVFHESKSESPSGQKAVAHAILNRVKSPKYPKTACGVVYQKIGGRHQFSFFNKGAAGLAPKPREMSMWHNAMKVAVKALYGEPDPINGAISFYNPRIGNPGRWARSAAYTVKIGGHVFFRPR